MLTEPAASDLEKYGKKEAGALTVSEWAERIAEGQGPALVRFVNTTSDVEGSKDKELRKAVNDSKNLVGLFTYSNEALCMAARHCLLFSVGVGEIDPKTHPGLNRTTAPILVVLDAQGKSSRVLSGNIRAAEILAAMEQVLKAKFPLEKILSTEREILKDVLALDAMQANLAIKQKDVDTAKGPRAQKLQDEIKALEARIAEVQARIKAQEDSLLPKG